MQYLVFIIILAAFSVSLKLIQTIAAFWFKQPISFIWAFTILVLFLLGAYAYIIFFLDVGSISHGKDFEGLIEISLFIFFLSVWTAFLMGSTLSIRKIKSAILGGMSAAFAIVLFLSVSAYFVFQNVFDYALIEGNSMFPVVEDGQIVLIDKLHKDIQNGDIIVFGYPRDPSRWQIQRVVASPGDTIYLVGGEVIINGRPESGVTQITEGSSFLRDGDEEVAGHDHYYVMGDNRSSSLDSRDYGPVRSENIQGKIITFGW